MLNSQILDIGSCRPKLVTACLDVLKFESVETPIFIKCLSVVEEIKKEKNEVCAAHNTNLTKS